MAWSPDGTMLAVTQTGKAQTVDVQIGIIRQVLVADVKHLGRVAWSPNGRIVAAADSGHGTSGIYLWDLQSGRFKNQFTRESRNVRSLLWQDERVLLTGELSMLPDRPSQLMCSFVVDSNTLLKETPRPAEAISPDGRFAVGVEDGMLRLSRFDNGETLLTIVPLRDERHVVINPDGHYRGSPGAEEELVYVAMAESGEQITLTHQEFSTRYGWKNDPTKVVADLKDLRGFPELEAPTADAQSELFADYIPLKKEDAEGNKIRALLFTGGHAMEVDPFLGMFDAIPDVAYGRVIHPAAAELLTPALAKQYDVLVFYDMWETGFTAQQQKAFVELLNSGIGVVGLHSTLVSHQSWPEWGKILGGHFFREETTINGRKVPASQTGTSRLQHNVTVADPDHPITQGLNSFSITCEAYKNVDRDPGIHVLLETDQTQNDPPAAWVKTYGKSRVFYLQFGHNRYVFEHPTYQQLLARAVRWAAGREAAPESAPR